MNEMNITSAKYVNFPETNEPASVLATIDGVEMFVSLDPANRHYAAIMEQVENGTLTIAEAE